MARKTSISLSDEDDALLHEQLGAGVPLRDIIRRGLGVERVDVALAQEAAARAVDAIEDRLRDVVREIIQDAVREALKQGGGYG